MKHIKKFNNINDLNSFKNSEKYIQPNLLMTSDKKIYYNQRYTKLEYLEITDHDTYNHYVKLDGTLGEYNETGATYTFKGKALLTDGSSYSDNNQYHLFGDEAQTRLFIRKHRTSNYIYSTRIFNNVEENMTFRQGDGNQMLALDFTKTQTSNISNSGNNDYSRPFKSTFGELDLYMFGSYKEKDPTVFSKFWFGKFYYLQLLKGNDIIIDLIPMYDGKLKQYGIFDKVKQKFYPLLQYPKEVS